MQTQEMVKHSNYGTRCMCGILFSNARKYTPSMLVPDFAGYLWTKPDYTAPLICWNV